MCNNKKLKKKTGSILKVKDLSKSFWGSFHACPGTLNNYSMSCEIVSRPYRPISVNSQSGGQNNKIVLHLKGLFLSGEKTTIVCPPDWELLKWVYLYSQYWTKTGL